MLLHGALRALTRWSVVSEVGHKRLREVSRAPSDSQWTSTRMLTLVFPTALKTTQETGSVKKEWSALVVKTLSLAPCRITPPLAHLGFVWGSRFTHNKDTCIHSMRWTQAHVVKKDYDSLSLLASVQKYIMFVSPWPRKAKLICHSLTTIVSLSFLFNWWRVQW